MNKLRKLRLLKQMPLYELARLSKVSTATISRLERTESAPSYLTAKRIAKAFNVEIKEIFPEINLNIGISKNEKLYKSIGKCRK